MDIDPLVRINCEIRQSDELVTAAVPAVNDIQSPAVEALGSCSTVGHYQELILACGHNLGDGQHFGG